jgi:uncharacterized protein (TIGR03437 family)
LPQIWRRFSSLRLLIAGSLISTCSAAAGPSTTLAHLPNAGVRAVKVDAFGNIYVAGIQGDASAPDSNDAFVAKLSPDGSKVVYSTKLGGSKLDYAVALDIDSTGAAYIFGQTQSPDFPVTPGALQATLLASSVQGFAAKVDAQGKLVYATLIGGSSDIYPSPGGLLVNAAGEAILSGQTIGGNFPATTGAPFTSADTNTFFVLKLDATGARVLGAIRGIGGRIASDDQGSVYVAGLQLSVPTKIPVTPGAFQSTYQSNACGGTGQMGMVCLYQYVTKLNASLSQIAYATYVTGSWGAAPAAIYVDTQHNVLLAGTTNSPDYPTTSNAFEPLYVANAPSPPQICLFGCFYPPPASGYFTKLNATGTALIYSTFFSGTQSDSIAFAAFTSGGIYLSGQAGSPDLPAFEGVPLQCMPQTFETRLSLDGSAVTAARIVPGSVLAYDSFTSTLLAWTGADLISFDPAAPPTPIACIVDAADLRPVTLIAPGELLSIFGAHFVTGIAGPSPGLFPASIDGITVAFNGVAGPLLYVSPQQINVQAPYEIANNSQVSLTLTCAQINESDLRTLPVTARNPVVFLDTAVSLASVDCHPPGQTYSGGPIPLALNSDGTRNTCSNPVSAGSVVRLFLSGLGVTTPSLVTGATNPAPGTPLNLPITFGNGLAATVVSATALPGSISGVWQVDIRMPPNQAGALAISLSVGSVPVRDTNLTIWVR